MSEQWINASAWTHKLSHFTFETQYVPLSVEEQDLLAKAVPDGSGVNRIIGRIEKARATMPGKWKIFAFADSVAPTDTERFAGRGGAISSAKSVWSTLIASQKVRDAAAERRVDFIALRAYRNMTYAREFRLFIYNGALKGMSQRYLDRHYRRLNAPHVRDMYWNEAKKFVAEVRDDLPAANLVMDIYFTHDCQVLIIDLNPFGAPTDPLLFRSWTQDWTQELGLRIIEPPLQLTGGVNVGF